MVPPPLLNGTSRGPGVQWSSDQERLRRLQLCESPMRRSWRSSRAKLSDAAKNHAIGPSSGGQTTKIHALTDTLGRPNALVLTAGNVSDIGPAPALLAKAGLPRHLIVNKSYDADAVRQAARREGCVPVISGKSNLKRKIPPGQAPLP